MGQEHILHRSITPQIDNEEQGEAPSSALQKKTSFILVITRNGHMNESVMDYAIGVADRLKYGILAVHIDTLPFFRDGGKRSRLFTAAVQESALIFQEKAKAHGVLVEHMEELGKAGSVVNRLCHADKHIEFVVVDHGIRLEEVTRQSPVPAFRVLTPAAKKGHPGKPLFHSTTREGVFRMSTTSRKRHVKNCFVFGALTAGIYAAVFTNQEVMMTYFSKGGLYALLPVALVFAVSYAHGNFTSSFWSALGIEASTVSAAKRAEMTSEIKESATVRKDTRPRAQVSA